MARKHQFHQFQVSQATGQPIFNPTTPPHVIPTYHHPQQQQMQAVQSQTYPSTAIRMFPHDGQQQTHIASHAYLVPTPPSTTPSPGQHHQQQAFHPGQQPSPAGGPPTQAFAPPQGQYVMLMPSNAPSFIYSNSQHQQQPLQVVMQQPQQQHPAQ